MEREIDVLHVDDERDILEQAKLFLEKEKEGLNIDTFESPKEALEKLSNSEYDAVIADYQMPEMDGLEFLENIRQRMGEDLPFVIFTGKGREEVAMEALNLGADAYLQKGGDARSQYGVLADTVVQAVERKHYKRRFVDFFENLPYMAFMIDPSGIIQELNKAFLQTTGYEKEDMVGKPMSELKNIIPEESLEKALVNFSQFLEKEEVEPFTIKYKHREGDIRHLEINAVAMRKSSDFDMVIGIGRDITEEKKTEKKHEIMTEGSSNGIYLFQDGEFKYVNEAMVELSGYSREELKDMNSLDLIHPDYREDIVRWTGQALEGDTSGLPEVTEVEALRKDDSSVWVQLTPSLVEYNGRPAIVGNVAEITERKKMESELEERVKELNCLYGISKLVEDSEATLEEALQRSVELIPPSWQYPDITCARIVLDDEEFKTENYRESEWKLESDIMVDGEKRGFIEVIYLEERPELEESPFLKEERELIDAIAERLGSVIKRLELEEELRESEKRYRSIFEGLDEAVFVLEGGEDYGEILEMNSATEELLGYSREELIRKDVLDLIAEGEEKLGEPDRERRHFVQKKVKNDGTEFWSEVTEVPFKYKGKNTYLSICRDITDCKEMEEKLRQSEEKYREVFTDTHDAMWIVDIKDGEFVYEEVNPNYAHDFVGLSKEEIEGKSLDELFEPETASRITENYAKVVEEKEPLEKEQHLKLPIGEKWHLTSLTPILDEEGNVNKIIGSGKDITERKKSEEREDFLHSLLRHDLRNKAQIVEGYLELLRETELSDDQKELVEKALKGSEEGMEIIEKVRTLRRVKEEEGEEVSISFIIRNVVEENKGEALEKNIEIQAELSEFECKVQGGQLLKELFTNLIGNSIQHSGGSEIRISGEELEEKCVISVEDDGKGIPDDVKDSIFERRYKKGENAGSGLGLYLVKEIVEYYGGSMEIEDSELGGARFDVYLKKA